MSWRVVVISKRAKLEYKMDYLVVRSDQVVKIHLSEIHTVIVESTAVSLTAMLLSKLQERKIKVVFCDINRNPESELVPYYGCHNSSEKIKRQLAWDEEFKRIVWTAIVKEKIQNQAKLIQDLKPEAYQRLQTYLLQVEPGDRTNREGQAARVYFNALFGSRYSRNSESAVNAALNYGYTILLSAINREIVCNGYLTQLGICHDNVFNHFNLSSDLIEPLRPLVDGKASSWEPFEELTPAHKLELVDLLNEKVSINNKIYYFQDALSIYCKSVLDSIEAQDVSLIRFITL